jgi:sporulation protein YlmC with PRC-barrel domain
VQGDFDMKRSAQAGAPLAWFDPPAGRTETGAKPERRRNLRLAGPSGRLMRAASLAGIAVVTRGGESIGTLTDLLLDAPRGRIAYAVVAQGGFMGLGERMQPIPWRALALDGAHGHGLVLNATRTVFESAPGFDKAHWPEQPDPAWHHALHRHYRCPPYWE